MNKVKEIKYNGRVLVYDAICCHCNRLIGYQQFKDYDIVCIECYNSTEK